MLPDTQPKTDQNTPEQVLELLFLRVLLEGQQTDRAMIGRRLANCLPARYKYPKKHLMNLKPGLETKYFQFAFSHRGIPECFKRTSIRLRISIAVSNRFSRPT